MQVVEYTKSIKKTLPAEERDKLVKKMRAEDDKIRTGMFEFIDAQGGWLEFSYRKYPGEPVKKIRLTHGEICDLPMGIIKHLNNTKKKVRRYRQDDISQSGNIPLRSYETISRLRFTPTDVM
jgi:hypothetical protein